MPSPKSGSNYNAYNPDNFQQQILPKKNQEYSELMEEKKMPKSERFKQMDHKLAGRMSKKKMQEIMKINNKAQLTMYYKQNPLHFYKPNKPDLLEHNKKMEESYDNTFNSVRQQVQQKSVLRSGVVIDGYIPN